MFDKKIILAHPFLFCLYKILFLFSNNSDNFIISNTIIPILFLFFVIFCLLAISGLLLGDLKKGAILISLIVFIFFSYGNIFELASNLSIAGINISRNRYLIIVLFMIITFSAYFIKKTRSDLKNITNILNIMSAFLVLVSSYNIGSSYFCDMKQIQQDEQSLRSSDRTASRNINADNADKLPNIYYIILDAYGREDTLKRLYQHDNKQFLDFLEEKGFYIAHKSKSNYCQTLLSLASSLNFKYLEKLVDHSKRALSPFQSERRQPFIKMLKNNRVVENLKQYGYRFIAFSSPYQPADFKDADKYYGHTGYDYSFVKLIIQTTPLRSFIKSNAYKTHRKEILFTLENLDKTTQLKGPLFVFAHILSPHPPFVFNENGGEVTPDRYYNHGDGSHFFKSGGTLKEYITGYEQQLKYINKKMMAAITGILEKSTSPPIIILQGDHGPGSRLNWQDMNDTDLEERMNILNSYYLPDGGNELLYESITPVNTFIVVFNYYFKTHYKLLKDKSYFSTRLKFNDFIEVP